MPKVDKQVLIPFGTDPKRKYVQNWPKGSKFLKVVALQEGIYTFFLVPDTPTLIVDSAGTIDSDEFEFIVAGPHAEARMTDEFIDVLTVYTEMNTESLREQGLPADYQAVIIFPIFMRKD